MPAPLYRLGEASNGVGTSRNAALESRRPAIDPHGLGQRSVKVGLLMTRVSRGIEFRRLVTACRGTNL